MKKGGIIALIVVGAVLLTAISGIGAYLSIERFAGLFGAPKSFTCGELSIELDRSFMKVPVDGYEGTFGNGDVTVLVTKYAYAENEALRDYSDEEFGRLVCDNSDGRFTLNASADAVYFDFTEEADDGDVNHGRAYVNKSDNAFWVVYFVTDADSFDSFAEDISAWADTVTFEK